MDWYGTNITPDKKNNLDSLGSLDFLEKALRAGRMDRRAFVTGALAMGVSLSVATGHADSVAAAAPKKGGRVRAAVTGGSTTDTFDPGEIYDLYMTSLQFGQLRNSLTEVDASGNLVGELAESWQVGADARTWHFKIRKDVEFHNGKTLDSGDVAASINHHLGEESTSAAKGILSGIRSIKTDGRHAVFVELHGSDVDFPYILSDSHLGICPADKEGVIDWASAIGTGGYILEEHEAGVRSLTKRNPNYWKEDAAYFDEVEIFQVTEAAARTSGLQSGDFDVMSKVDVKTVHLLQKTPELDVISTTGNKQVTLPMRTDTPPFDNNHVRLAVKHIVDREQWLKLVLRGYGELGNDNPIGPANAFRATPGELPQRHYDPDKALYHLKQAGMDRLKIQFHAAETAFSGAVDAGYLMRETAHGAGIDIDVIQEPEDGYWSSVWRQRPFCASYWNGRPTENWMFSQAYAADSNWNDSYWLHDRFNELLIMGRSELDQNRRREIYIEMQQIVHHEGGVCIPLFEADLSGISKRVGVPDIIGNNIELDGGKFSERWWFV